MISANAATNRTAKVGVPFLLSLDHRRQPGTAPSREKASVIREALVRQAMPQKTWPMTEIRITAFAAAVDSAVTKTAREVPCDATLPALIPLTSVAAKVIASSTIQPIAAE